MATQSDFSRNADAGIRLTDIDGNVSVTQSIFEQNDGYGLAASDGADGNAFAIGGNLTIQTSTIRDGLGVESVGRDLLVEDNIDLTLSLMNETLSVGEFASLGDLLVDLIDSNFLVGRTLTLNDGATLSIDDTSSVCAATVLINPGATVGGKGTICANSHIINNGGTLGPGFSPGHLTLDAEFEQAGTGTLVLEIGGTVPGVEYDVLEVNGLATIAGFVQLVFIGGYAPETGDSFDVLQVAGTLDLSSAMIEVFGLPAGLNVDVDLLSGTVTVVIGGDFDGDGDLDITDIDLLVANIAGGSNDPRFDLTGDGFVDLADRDQWLAESGALNLPSGNPYLLADANLDGVVDISDFNIWNANKFTNVAAWSRR